MAQIILPGGFWFPAEPGGYAFAGVNPSFSNSTLSAAAHKFAKVFTVPRSGTLNRFEFRVGTVANNPDNGLRASFQDLDASGNPDGTQDQFRTMAGPFAANSWNTPGLITSDGTDTGTKRSVTAGQRLAAVVEFESFVAADSIDISYQSLAGASASQAFEGVHHYVDHFTAAWSKPAGSSGMFALEYETLGYVPIIESWFPALGVVGYSIGNATTPDEVAMRFQVPLACTCDGAWVKGAFAGNTDIFLLDAADTVLASATIVSTALESTGSAVIMVRWAGVSLSANTTYRLAIRPSTATTIGLPAWQATNAARIAAAVGGAEVYTSTRVNLGAWTDVTLERLHAGIHIHEVDNASGTGTIQLAIQSPAIVINQGVVGY